MAIAKDSSVDGGFDGTGTHTTSLTIVSSTNTKLFVGVETNSGLITSVTWNGVAMTQVTNVAEAGGSYNGKSWVYELINPASGTHNIVVTWSGGGNSNTGAVCYSGVEQVAATIFATASTNSSGDLTASVTTTVNNSWVFVWGSARSSPDPTAKTATINSYDAAASYDFIGDTGVITPAGSVTAGCNFINTDGNTVILVVLAPATSGIAFDAASNSGEQLAQSSYNWSHTCAGTDRYLKVAIGMLSLAQTVSGITYNGVALVFLGAQSSVSGAARIELWGLVAPATGSNTIAVTLTGAVNSGGVAASYTGVHQTFSTESLNSAQATNVGAADATVDVTTVADNDWVIDGVVTDDTSITVGAGQTSRNNISGTVGSVADSDEGPKTPAGSVTMSWSGIGAAATWAIAAVALRPTAASNGVNSNFLMFFGPQPQQ